MTTTRKRLTDEERIAQAQAKADAVKDKVRRSALAQRAILLGAYIRHDQMTEARVLAVSILAEIDELSPLPTVCESKP